MKIDTIQTSFVGGEFAPALFGRTDIAQYANACEIVENLMIRPYGPLLSTPGTEFINDAKYDAVLNSGQTYFWPASGAVNFGAFGGGPTDDDTESNVQQAIYNCTIKEMVVRLGLAPGTNQSRAFNLRVNSSNSTLDLTLNNSVTYGTVATDIAIGAPSNDLNKIAVRELTTSLTTRSAFAVSLVLETTGDWQPIVTGRRIPTNYYDAGVNVPLNNASCVFSALNGVTPNNAIQQYVGWSSMVAANGYFQNLVNLFDNTLSFSNPSYSSLHQINTVNGDQSGNVSGCNIAILSGSKYGISATTRSTSAGQIVYVQNNYTNERPVSFGFHTLQFVPSTAGMRIFDGCMRMAGTSTRYTGTIGRMHTTGLAETTDDYFIVAPYAATISNLYVNNYGVTFSSASSTTNGTATFVFRKNGADTSLVVTYSSTTTAASSTISFQVAKGDRLSIRGHSDTTDYSGLVVGFGWTWQSSSTTLTPVFMNNYNYVATTNSYITVAESRIYGKSRLIPFIFARNDSYVIEIGENYFRFYTDGAVVLNGSSPFELTHDYTEEEIFDIQYSQINDVIYLTHPDHPPKKLTRITASSWTLEDLAFVGGPFFTDNAILTGSTTLLLTSATISVASVTTSGSSVTLSASSNLFTPSNSTIAGHVNTLWKIGATVTNGTTGLSEQGYVKITAVTNPSTATATIMRNLVSTAATTTWAQGSWSDVLGWPARTTFYQQRLAFARTNYQPQNVWLSKTFIFEDFALDGGQDDDAIDIQLASNESNEIKWLVPGADLIAGTYGGEFAITTGDASPLTPANTNVRKDTSWGSEAIVPKKIGNFFYYVQRFGKKLRELFFNFDTLNSYKSIDRTIYSPHISGPIVTSTGNTGFIDLAYQQNPDTVLWAVCSNGTIATMTREVDQEIQGWTRQTTDGAYESIASIPSRDQPHDEVWVIAKRVINDGASERRYIERFKSQIVPERKDECFYIHSGLTYNAYDATTTPTATSISLSATAGTTVVVTSSSAYFASGDIGQRIRAIDSDGATIGELKITAFTSSTIIVGEVKFTFDATSYSSGSWGLSAMTISGLDHLETKDLTVLADGGTDGDLKTVSNGTITLNHDYFVINAGLKYVQKFKTLPQEAGSQRGTSQGKIQRINQVGFKVNRSHTGFYYGRDEDNIDKVQFRNASTFMGTTEELFSGVIPNLSFNGDYAYGAQVYVENSDPLPIEILSLMTSLDTNDK